MYRSQRGGRATHDHLRQISAKRHTHERDQRSHVHTVAHNTSTTRKQACLCIPGTEIRVVCPKTVVGRLQQVDRLSALHDHKQTRIEERNGGAGLPQSTADGTNTARTKKNESAIGDLEQEKAEISSTENNTTSYNEIQSVLLFFGTSSLPSAHTASRVSTRSSKNTTVESLTFREKTNRERTRKGVGQCCFVRLRKHEPIDFWQ